MKYKYLESYDLNELIFYCRKNAIKIVIEHHNEDRDKIKYYRYLYAGYIYGKKVASFIKRRNLRITNVDLYNYFKHQKNNKSPHHAVDMALYDIMNFISDNF